MSVLRLPQHPGSSATAELISDSRQRRGSPVAPASAIASLAGALQKTLELEHLLATFHAHAKALFGSEGLSYRNERDHIDITFGKDAPHHCNYFLTVEQTQLGQLGLARRRKFADEELEQLEQLLSALLYPLRNALLYKSAVQSALRDPLTGACNRAAMDTALHHEIAVSRRHGTPLSLVVIDIDHFKRINDNHGHTVGDCVLRALSQHISECIRDSDMLFRYGGEEFTVLLKNTDLEGAELLAQRIRRSIAACRCGCEGIDLRLTVSAGVACLRIDDDPHSIFDRADKALYHAKQSGRNRVETAPA